MDDVWVFRIVAAVMVSLSLYIMYHIMASFGDPTDDRDVFVIIWDSLKRLVRR